MLDVSVAYHRYGFLGYEFLTWLWNRIETEPESVVGADGRIEIGNRIVLEKRYQGDLRESVIITGDDAGLEEGMLALKKGAMVSEIHLGYRQGERKWHFTLKGESFHLTKIQMPETRSAASVVRDATDIETRVVEKALLCEPFITLLDRLYGEFVRLRVSDRWQSEAIPAIRRWIESFPNSK